MNWFLVLCGVIGNIGFGVACIPMAMKCLLTGRNFGIPLSTAWTFLISLSGYGTYIIGTYGFDPLVVVITSVEIASWATVLWLSYWPVTCRHLTRINETGGGWTCTHCKATHNPWDTDRYRKD